ncbi:MAG: hypothetical protein HZC38_11495 [Chloroflexi bacterium]|nr:hypothetical protein [Chloroflexota bacterium]
MLLKDREGYEVRPYFRSRKTKFLDNNFSNRLLIAPVAFKLRPSITALDDPRLKTPMDGKKKK